MRYLVCKGMLTERQEPNHSADVCMSPAREQIMSSQFTTVHTVPHCLVLMHFARFL